MIHVITSKDSALHNREIAKLCGNDCRKMQMGFLLVPEQFTLQSERILIEQSGKQGLLFTNVLSPHRLANFILSSHIDINHTLLDESASMSVLNKIMLHCQDELLVFGKAAQSPSFLNDLEAFFSELTKNLITPDELLAFAEDARTSHTLLKKKMHDLSLLYKTYTAYLNTLGVMTPSMLYTAAASYAPTYEKLKGANIYIQHFNTFDQNIYVLLRALLLAGANLTLLLIDDEESERPCFAVSKRTFANFKALAQQTHTRFLNTCLDETPPRPDGFSKEDSARTFLKNHLYTTEQTAYPHPTDLFSVHACNTKRDEVLLAIHTIQNLLTKENVPFAHIGICLCDFEGYRALIEEEFTKANLPFFIDAPLRASRALYYKIVLLILSVWDTKELRSLCDLCKLLFDDDAAKEDLYALQRYTTHFNISLSQCKTPFSKNHRKINYDLARLNHTRERVINLFSTIKTNFQGQRNAQALITALQRCLDLFGVHALCEKKQASLSPKEQSEAQQSEKLIDAVLDNTKRILQHEPITPQALIRLLTQTTAATKLKLIPETAQQIDIGDLRRSRFAGKRHLLFLGANQGALPPVFTDTDVLTQDEKQILYDKKLALTSLQAYKMRQSDFLLYNLLTLPDASFTFFYATHNDAGEPLYPSSMITHLFSLFPKARHIAPEMHDPIMFSCPQGALDTACRYLSAFSRGLLEQETQRKDDIKALLSALMAGEEQPLLFDSVRERLEDSGTNRLDKAAKQALEEDTIVSSITRLQQYSQCPFSYFADYVLCLHEPLTGSVHRNDVGTFLHEALREFTQTHLSQPPYTPPVSIEKTMRTIIENALAHTQLIAPANTCETPYLITALTRSATRAAEAIIEELKNSRFVIESAEERFGKGERIPYVTLRTKEGKTFYITGIIDRIDRLKTSDGDVVRIIDYKTSAQAIDLSKIFYGLSLQLPIYVRACENTFNAKTGGVLYFELDAPFTSVKTTQAFLESSRAQTMPHIDALLVENPPNATPPPQEKKTVYPNATVTTLTRGQFAHLVTVCNENALNLIEHMHALSFPISPARYGTNSACTYCKHKALCQFDPQRHAQRVRTYKPLSKQDVENRLCPETHQN